MIFVKQGLFFSELSTSSLSLLGPYSDYVEVNISLNDFSSLSFLNVYAPSIRSSTKDSRTNFFSSSILPFYAEAVDFSRFRFHRKSITLPLPLPHPWSQHIPSLIVPRTLALSVPSKSLKQWNFRKANWNHYNTLTNKLAKILLPPDPPDVNLAYQDFCNVIRTAAKNSIPSCRNKYMPSLSARISTMHFCSHLKKAILAGLPLSCSLSSTTNAEIDGPRQFRLSTFPLWPKSMDYIEQPNW